MPRSWLWGVGLGLVVGGAVVLVSSVRFGFSAPLLLLGMVLVVGFGALSALAGAARRRTPID